MALDHGDRAALGADAHGALEARAVEQLVVAGPDGDLHGAAREVEAALLDLTQRRRRHAGGALGGAPARARRSRRAAAQALGLAREQRPGAAEEVADGLHLLGAVARVQLLPGAPERAEDLGELARAVVDHADDHLAAIVRVLLAPDEPGLLQAIEHAGDRAGGQPGELGELAGGHRLAASGAEDEVEALLVGEPDSQTVGDRLVEQHGARAQLAAEIVARIQGPGAGRVLVVVSHARIISHSVRCMATRE